MNRFCLIGIGFLLGVAVTLIVGVAILWPYVRDLRSRSLENWQPVVIAVREIPPNAKITTDMITLSRFPQEMIAPDAVTSLWQAEGKTTKAAIRKSAQVRTVDLSGR